MSPLAAAPGLLDLVIDDQDHAQDWLKTGRVAAAITGDTRPVGGCDCVVLGRMRYRATASPDFVQRHFPDGVTPASLARAPSLRFNAKDGLQDRWVRALTGRRIALPIHQLPSSQAFAQATRLGMGWGLNPEMTIADDLATGSLIDLSPDLPLDVTLTWQTARITAPAIAALTRSIVASARTHLLPPAGPQPN